MNYIMTEQLITLSPDGIEGILCGFCRLQYWAEVIISDSMDEDHQDIFAQVIFLREKMKAVFREVVNTYITVLLKGAYAKELYPIISESACDALSYLYLIVEEYDKAENMMYCSWESRRHKPWKNNIREMDYKLAFRLSERYLYQGKMQESNFFRALSDDLFEETLD
jgi:hypothetical protein